jgi:two-component system sensor histidine kinase FlrB
MNTLPRSADRSQQSGGGASAGILANIVIGGSCLDDEQSLRRAFRTFAEVAASLENSYAELQQVVNRLQRELAFSHSELARNAEENRSMRAHLDRILEALPCGVLVTSCDGSITRANPEALRFLAGAAFSSQDATSLSQLSCAIQHLLESSRGGNGETEAVVSQDEAAECWWAVRHAFVEESAGSSSIFILRDVTERKQLEHAQEGLRKDQALAEMSALLAHEIRNPLGSLELFAGLLAESNLDGESRQWIQHVQAGLRTLAATVNNVLQFHSMAMLERAPVDLGQLLVWARGFLHPLAQQSHIALGLQNRVCGSFLLGDRHRLEQVLLNLVLNSVRAMPGGGWIELGGHVLPDGSAVEVSVSDNGPGIPGEDLLHIFEPGFSRRANGPGLGLTVCRKIVDLHGGTIRVESRPGQGAKFTLTFPLHPPAERNRA